MNTLYRALRKMFRPNSFASQYACAEVIYSVSVQSPGGWKSRTALLPPYVGHGMALRSSPYTLSEKLTKKPSAHLRVDRTICNHVLFNNIKWFIHNFLSSNATVNYLKGQGPGTVISRQGAGPPQCHPDLCDSRLTSRLNEGACDPAIENRRLV